MFDWLDIFTTILGLLYIYLEYKAHIGLWIVGIIMPALDVYLYYNHGLYGDAGMAVYYTLAAIYGYVAWKLGSSKEKAPLKISHTPLKLYLPILLFFLVAFLERADFLIRSRSLTFWNVVFPLSCCCGN